MPIRIFKIGSFARWARKAGLPDAALCDAMLEIAGGLIDAHLGGQLIKKRVAGRGRGKRGASRAILAYRPEQEALFSSGLRKASATISMPRSWLR